MIREIKELNFPSYATLQKATVTLKDMGDKTITSQVAIDGQIAPDFSFDWEVEFQGEKYIMPLRSPAGAKGNDSLTSKIDLTFKHWAQYQLQRWYFFTLASEEAGVVVPDKYIASVSLNLGNFCKLFSQILEYYFEDAITIDLNEKWQYAQEPVFVDISHSYLWDVLLKIHELWNVRWEIVASKDNDPARGVDRYVIRIGYKTDELDHIFEYGFDGGLLKVERQVQDDNIRNLLIGRGGDKNIPFRYFKCFDPKNPTFPADPDWVTELANVPFDRLRSAEFRSYVQGWKVGRWHEYEKDEHSRWVDRSETAVPWAWDMGFLAGAERDGKFIPVEYVKDDESIKKYGILMGGLDDNDDIYPSIQGVTLPDLGRIDETVDIEKVRNDVPDITDTFASTTIVDTLKFGKSFQNGFTTIAALTEETLSINVGSFTVPEGLYASVDEMSWILDAVVSYDNIENGNLTEKEKQDLNYRQYLDIQENSKAYAVNSNKEELPLQAVPAGTYDLVIKASVRNTNGRKVPIMTKLTCEGPSVRIYSNEYKDPRQTGQTFDIWIKNVWGTEPEKGEDPVKYAQRVWGDILGNHLGEDAAVCFSTGWLSTSEDYVFKIYGMPVYDTSRVLSKPDEPVYHSHWRLTLIRSNADYDSIGIYVPSTQRQGVAGDCFYFIGINLTQTYVEWAENRLHNYKLDALEKVKEIIPTWVVGLDKVRIGTPQYNDAKALIDQLKIGGSIRLADKRFIPSANDKSDTGQPYITLYLQSLTYKFNEQSNSANFTPDVEITLGNDYTVSANPVATIQGSIDTINRQLGSVSISNLQQIIRQVGDKLYLRKDGLTDRSYSPTYFTELLAAFGFRQGMVGGRGWGFFQDENGKWVLETDRVNVRDEMQVNTLVINQVDARGGMIIESAASITVTHVEMTRTAYRCYFDTKGGSVMNLFQINDIAYCHRWMPDNTTLKYYKYRISAVGIDYIELDLSNYDGTGTPYEGDVIVQYGNYTIKDRQFVIIRDVIGGGFERMLSGLNSVTAKGDEYYFAGYQSSTGERFFIGNNNEYVLYQQGKVSVSGTLSVTTKVGDVTLENYIKKFIPDVDLSGWEYIRKALINGETTVLGGLILSNMIQLGTGSTSLGTFEVYSGINGQPLTRSDASDYVERGYGIAAWYGGNMDDKLHPDPKASTHRFAKSLFRFDGSGYFADGNIRWDNAGGVDFADGKITIGANGSLTLASGISIEGGGENAKTLQSLINTLNHFTTNFEPVTKDGKVVNWTDINSTNPLFAVKSKVGFYSDSFISAMGMNPGTSEGGGGSGVTRLAQLDDVSLSALAKGNILSWDGSRWKNYPLEDFGVIDDIKTDILEVINRVADIKYFLDVEGDDPNKWFDGESLSRILESFKALLGSSSWTTSSFEGESIRHWLTTLRNWVGAPSLDPGDWEDGSFYNQFKQSQLQSSAMSVGSLAEVRERALDATTYFNQPRLIYITGSPLGYGRVVTGFSTRTLLIETKKIINEDGSLSSASSSETALMTFASTYDGSSWSAWKQVSSIRL